jgi:LysR family transcriptional regulator, mexEF-oprN operon transcriptional activator
VQMVTNRINPHFVDMNLLKAFDAMARERSVTRAAERLRVGQPAMSYSLRRLRDMLGDELFVRTSRGMEPTPVALELMVPIRSALDQLTEALASVAPFNPSDAVGTFTIGMPDWLAADLLPKLLGFMADRAPNMGLRLRSFEGEAHSKLLEEGTIDVAIGQIGSQPGPFRYQKLFSERHICVFSRTLVAASDPITLSEYTATPHVLMSSSGEFPGLVDDALSKLGTSRRIVMSGTQFLLVPYLLQSMAAIATLPERFATQCCTVPGLRISPVPFPDTTFELGMIWHNRTNRNPSQKWFRNLLSSTIKVRELRPRTETPESPSRVRLQRSSAGGN